MRRRLGKNFRKRLGVYSYKVRTHYTHKKPGVIPLNIKQNLLEQNTHRSKRMIKILEANSHYPFGKFTRRNKFMFDANRVPLYNVPDLTDFDLKPYVSVHTPQIDEETKARLRSLNDFTNPENFGRFNESLPATGKE